jgi:rare lipoprotein A
MKHLIWIVVTAALVSFTVDISELENHQKPVTNQTGAITALFEQVEKSGDQISKLPADTAIVVENGFTQIGHASYYANKFHGRRTSSGTIYHKDSLSAAHKTLKLGTLIRVTNLANDSVVIVKVTDRMGRTPHILDLSLAAAKQLNYVRNGITKVKIEEIKQPLIAVK